MMFDYLNADQNALVSHAQTALAEADMHKADAAASRGAANKATAIAGRAALAIYSRSNMPRTELNKAFKERLGETAYKALRAVFSMAGSVSDYFKLEADVITVEIGRGEEKQELTVSCDELLDDDCLVTINVAYKAIRERQKTRAVKEAKGDAASREAIAAYIRTNPDKCAGLCVDDIWSDTAGNLHERARIVDLGNAVLKQEQDAQLAERENMDREKARVDAINTLSHADMILALRKAGYTVSKKKADA